LDKYEIDVEADKTTETLVHGLEFVQYFDSMDEGDWSLIGEVVNNSDQTASYVEVAATLYDAEDNVVDVGFTTLERSVMFPEDLSPFEIWVGDVHGDPVRYEIIVYGDLASDWVLEDLAKMEMVSIDYYIDTFDDLVVVGEVMNADESNAQFAKVFASFYDENDNLVGIEWTYAWRDVFEPEDLSPFSLNLFDTPDTVDHWTVWVQGTKTEDPPEGALSFESTDNTIDDDYLVTFTGTIKNDGTTAMKYIEVAVTIYNEEKEVVMTDVEYLDEELAAGSTLDFQFEVQTDDRASSFELYVQGSEAE
jgi:hypothetical protein